MLGFGIAVGASGVILNEPSTALAKAPAVPVNSRFLFPVGGCTEAGITLFDKGPYGKDPFRIFE